MSDKYNTGDRKDKSNPIIIMDAIVDAYASLLQFYSRLNRSFLDALCVPFTLTFATEMWLYDSPPVIGEIYRQFVLDCYQNNLFIKNHMSIYEDSEPSIQIDLGKIKAPFLNVIASKDDLVAPESSKALNGVIGSSDKSVLEFNSGHVGACIGSRAHEELWPKVGEWLKARSLPQ